MSPVPVPESHWKILELAEEQSAIPEVPSPMTWTLVDGRRVEVYPEMALDEARSVVTELLASGHVELFELKTDGRRISERLLTHQEALADDVHWEYAGNTDRQFWYEVGLGEAGAAVLEPVGRKIGA